MSARECFHNKFSGAQCTDAGVCRMPPIGKNTDTWTWCRTHALLLIGGTKHEEADLIKIKTEEGK